MELCLLDIARTSSAGAVAERSARSPMRALEIVTTVINSAALRFVPSEDLQTEV
jgi:hypothetical protein